ncbi:23S rRNA U2552 (ribose-2'-O)-methylase RlmE/FtsJ (RlmE) (PDB:1EIZ) (PUBMED:10769117) [Commensalibacter communis]|uniref:Ribosomal RNA large subunit methyltransferase E n=1 Tax=Commensalibacter communis TaxID=2972786 RepID=A0A9W4TQE2_9PROT|nr:RlmE family RNA methyltransferase [Commensalibacter communis]CAI3926549.1 23S rRNA U2552 (ribose-2'-O)-methylase RlmE/FtsJ (RlmE) (PDB:1EIZ) (PUBMED:10769117) [Commensalibacter communis]CAI3927125.1 23S rRNA U2552 (ribose-2'-O)-methylase RlmE/FtsJ (RlmE) (PDB:1EIZ) (PUBMED:10769117) [Commensalibacter communis]CAI3934309.1 23S rRNA U2552 (ribose-2'-O)-methylase RlmE/FtsJ (RlmE) (PDB:1EIZ) (PUBMED:10769117) [Commensalibacter communis]CAI3935903.1 23S rRNA U2552 (ribose-2'-O)-methylase RlmE/Fts
MDEKNANESSPKKKKSRFSTASLTVKLKKSNGRSTSQQRWLTRQLNDPYVRAAQQQGWRSRAAFKLIELDEKFKFLRPGLKVIDLGAAPGGWSQVAVHRKATKVVGIDLLAVDPIPGADIIQGDFTDPDNMDILIDKLGGKADLVMSDMAPNTTGHSSTDHIRIINLTEDALAFALDILDIHGIFIAKVFQGGSEKGMLDTLKQNFKVVKHAKPPASRKESKELYVIATGFKGKPSIQEG